MFHSKPTEQNQDNKGDSKAFIEHQLTLTHSDSSTETKQESKTVSKENLTFFPKELHNYLFGEHSTYTELEKELAAKNLHPDLQKLQDIYLKILTTPQEDTAYTELREELKNSHDPDLKKIKDIYSEILKSLDVTPDSKEKKLTFNADNEILLLTVAAKKYLIQNLPQSYSTDQLENAYSKLLLILETTINPKHHHNNHDPFGHFSNKCIFQTATELSDLTALEHLTNHERLRHEKGFHDDYWHRWNGVTRYAAERHLVEVLDYLPSAQRFSKKAAVIGAMKSNHLSLVKSLFKKYTDLNPWDSSKETDEQDTEDKFIEFAVQRGQFETLKFLSDQLRSMKEPLTPKEATSLFNFDPTPEIIDYLITEHKADLHKAVFFLLKALTSPCSSEDKIQKNQIALDYILKKYNINLNTVLFIAAEQGDEHVFKYLIKQGADIHTSFQDASFNTLEHLEERYGDTTLSLSSGEHLNNTPLWCVIRRDRSYIFEYLLEEKKIALTTPLKDRDQDCTLLEVAQIYQTKKIINHLQPKQKITTEESKESSHSPSTVLFAGKIDQTALIEVKQDTSGYEEYQGFLREIFEEVNQFLNREEFRFKGKVVEIPETSSIINKFTLTLNQNNSSFEHGKIDFFENVIQKHLVGQRLESIRIRAALKKANSNDCLKMLKEMLIFFNDFLKEAILADRFNQYSEYEPLIDIIQNAIEKLSKRIKSPTEEKRAPQYPQTVSLLGLTPKIELQQDRAEETNSELTAEPLQQTITGTAATLFATDRTERAIERSQTILGQLLFRLGLRKF